MIDVKKLITGFLILAAAASLSAVLLLGTSNAPAAQNDTQQNTQTADTGSTNTASPLMNAFLAQSTTTAAASIPTSNISVIVATSSDDPNNLTDILANDFAMNVAEANPDGPEQDGSGNLSLTQPDMNTLALTVANATATQSLQIPDWDYEAEAQPIKIENSSAPSDVSAYSAALSDIVNQHFVSTNLSNIVNNPNPDPSQAGTVETEVQTALGDVLALQVPKPLANFQKSIVTMLVYEKNTVALAGNANSDPLKTALILQGEQNSYQAALQNLEAQIQNADAIQGFSFGAGPEQSENKAVAFFDSFLGIKTANAQYVTFDPSNFGEWLLQFANNIAVQILKNVLIAEIQQHVLSWIQGSGAPRFLTNWATTLVQAYEQTALNILNSQMSCAVAPEFGAQVRTTLSIYYRPAGLANSCGDIFQASLGGHTLSQFYGNFANGGWLAYGVTALPVGNYYGSTFFQAQLTDAAAQQNQQATQAQSIAGQGFKGDLVCDDGSNPNTGSHTECQDANGNNFHANPNNTCPAGLTPITISNGGQCADGTQPQTVTPPIATGYSLNSALDSTPKLVASANDITGLIGALVSSLLNSLATMAVSAGTNGILGINPTSIQGGGTPPAPIPLFCNPPTETVSSTIPVTIGAGGGSTNGGSGQPSYTWTSSDGYTTTGYIFSHAFQFPGAYTVTLGDTNGDTPATCHVTAQ